MAIARPVLQASRREHRRAERDEVSFRADLRHGDAPRVQIHVVDVSPLGFRARCDTCPASGSIQISLPGLGFISARIVWALGGRIGGEFARAIDPDLYRQMLAAAPDQAPWHD